MNIRLPSRPPSGRSFWFAAILGAAWLVGAGLGRPAPAHAQAPETDRSFDVQLWQPALGPRPYFTIDGAKVPAHLELSVQLATSYQRNPFTIGTVQGSTRIESDIETVRDQLTTELDAGHRPDRQVPGGPGDSLRRLSERRRLQCQRHAHGYGAVGRQHG